MSGGESEGTDRSSNPDEADARVVGASEPRDAFPSSTSQDFDEEKSGQDLAFRKWYGWSVPIAVALVLISSNVLMYLIAAAYDWKVPSALAAAFFASVFGEVVGLMALIVRSIFPTET